MIENWKPVVGYEGLYEVSDCGNVKSSDRVVAHRNYATKEGVFANKTIKGKPLAPSHRKYGRRYVALCKGGDVRSEAIARLVLAAFVGPPTAPYALHKDDDHSNDSVSNLYWGTQAENMKDKVGNGNSLKGSKHHNATLNEMQVREIRAKLAAGADHHALAAEYGSTGTAIQSIKHRRTWKWLA